MNKNIKAVIFLGLLAVAFTPLYLKYGRGKFIKQVAAYSIRSNTGKVIPADLYVDDLSDYKSYLMVFSDSLNFENDDLLLDVLLIDSATHAIGTSCTSRKQIVKLNGNTAYKLNAVEQSVGIPNPEKLGTCAIHYIRLTKNGVVFNAYGPLRQFGDSIILTIDKEMLN